MVPLSSLQIRSTTKVVSQSNQSQKLPNFILGGAVSVIPPIHPASPFLAPRGNFCWLLRTKENTQAAGMTIKVRGEVAQWWDSSQYSHRLLRQK